MRGQLIGEAALSDPRFAAEEDQPASTRRRFIERLEQLPKLAVATDERRPSVLLRHARCPSNRIEA
jgi:hypothetical protein